MVEEFVVLRFKNFLFSFIKITTNYVCSIWEFVLKWSNAVI